MLQRRQCAVVMGAPSFLFGVAAWDWQMRAPTRLQNLQPINSGGTGKADNHPKDNQDSQTPETTSQHGLKLLEIIKKTEDKT